MRHSKTFKNYKKKKIKLKNPLKIFKKTKKYEILLLNQILDGFLDHIKLKFGYATQIISSFY
jgi:hypothetical protein